MSRADHKVLVFIDDRQTRNLAEAEINAKLGNTEITEVKKLKHLIEALCEKAYDAVVINISDHEKTPQQQLENELDQLLTSGQVEGLPIIIIYGSQQHEPKDFESGEITRLTPGGTRTMALALSRQLQPVLEKSGR